MNFNSLQYLLFLPVTLVLYFILPKKIKNPMLLLASFYFYACWQPVYTLLMLFSILATYFCGILVAKRALGQKRLWLVLCLLINLGILFFFKYYNFFSETVNVITGASIPTVNVLLPVGISFYTFQALGYTIDVYRGDIPAEKNFIDYALFVSFFPQLVAGPIERTGNIIPALKEKRSLKLSNLGSGTSLILWGMFKKVVIADNLALIVNSVYNDPVSHTGVQFVFATLCFSFQIYCDFSAYSDIARGSARIMGIELMKNFDFPYGALSIKDFWSRWHISLSTWFKDYLYFPLGGSRCGKFRSCFNLMVVFVVSGLWHGAALTFLLWGVFHGLYRVFGVLLTPFQNLLDRIFGKKNPVLIFLKWLCTFILVNLAWVLFRANSISDAVYIFKKIFMIPHDRVFTLAPTTLGDHSLKMLIVILASVVLLNIVDFISRRRSLEAILCKSVILRYGVYIIILLAIFIFGYYGSGFDPQDFVYFQF